MAEDITLSPPENVPSSGSKPSLAEEPIDLSAQTPSDVHLQTIPTGVPFDPEPQRERIRGRIAQGLLWMLAGVMLLAFGSMWTGVDAELLKTVLTIIFGPLVALVSAATGFYYGSRSSSS